VSGSCSGLIRNRYSSADISLPSSGGYQIENDNRQRSHPVNDPHSRIYEHHGELELSPTAQDTAVNHAMS